MESLPRLRRLEPAQHVGHGERPVRGNQRLDQGDGIRDRVRRRGLRDGLERQGSVQGFDGHYVALVDLASQPDRVVAFLFGSLLDGGDGVHA